jgi:acetoin utilization deacetylase AcuC-like enzyme
MNDLSTISIIFSARLLDHDTGGGEHPETPERLRAVRERLASGLILPSIIRDVEPQPAGRQWLTTFHSEGWLFRFEEEALFGRSYIMHPDNQICFDSYEVALLSAGCGLKGIDLVEQGAAGPVFCAARPPGHHAEAGMPMGFCFINNCVVAARYWQQRYGRRRICVLDFDAHHGNGIQSAFAEDAESLYISIHEHPSFSFPGTGYAEETGAAAGSGTILNIPLSPGAGDKRFLEAWHSEVERKLLDFGPDALIVAAGFDGHRLDDMSGLNYSTGLYRILGERIGSWAVRYMEGRLVSILEGGYHPQALAESVESYLAGLLSAL